MAREPICSQPCCKVAAQLIGHQGTTTLFRGLPAFFLPHCFWEASTPPPPSPCFLPTAPFTLKLRLHTRQPAASPPCTEPQKQHMVTAGQGGHNSHSNTSTATSPLMQSIWLVVVFFGGLLVLVVFGCFFFGGGVCSVVYFLVFPIVNILFFLSPSSSCFFPTAGECDLPGRAAPLNPPPAPRRYRGFLCRTAHPRTAPSSAPLARPYLNSSTSRPEGKGGVEGGLGGEERRKRRECKNGVENANKRRKTEK